MQVDGGPLSLRLGAGARGGVAVDAATALAFGDNYTLTKGGEFIFLRGLTAWPMLDRASSEAQVETFAADAAALGFNAVQVNLLDGGLIQTNRNGEAILPTQDPSAVNQQFLTDSTPLIQALIDNDLIPAINLAWGTAMVTPFTEANGVDYVNTICDWLRGEWPTYGGWIITPFADNHPNGATQLALVDAMMTRVRQRMGSRALLSYHPAVPSVAANANFDGEEITTQGIRDYWVDRRPWEDCVMLQGGHAYFRARASAYEQMAYKERKRAIRSPHIDMESGYLEIPAGLPADPTAVALAANPIDTVDGSRDFTVRFNAAHGLIAIPVADGKRRWLYGIGLSVVAGLDFNGGNWEIVGYVDATTLIARHDNEADATVNAGGGVAGTGRLRVEKLEAERLGPYHISKRAFFGPLMGAFGSFDSAEGFYNWNAGDGVGGPNNFQNDKYLPQVDVLTRLAHADVQATLISKLFWEQRPLSKRVAQRLEPLLFTTLTNASPIVATRVAHGRVLNDPISFRTSASLVTGLTPRTVYYAIPTGADTMNVAATPGGAAINGSGAGSGGHTMRAPGLGTFVNLWGSNSQIYLNNINTGGINNLGGNVVQAAIADDKSYAIIASACGREFDLNLADYLTLAEDYEFYWLKISDGSISHAGRVYRGGSYSAGAHVYTGGTEYTADALRTIVPADDQSYRDVHFTPPTTDTTFGNAGTIATREAPGHFWVGVLEVAGAYPALDFS